MFFYRPHPHYLVGPNCVDGIYTAEIDQKTMTHQFLGLGIQCVKRKDVVKALNIRKSNQVDPYRSVLLIKLSHFQRFEYKYFCFFAAGFNHLKTPSNLDLNSVRLCFQVFLGENRKGKIIFCKPLKPIVSDPIYDRKALTHLDIVKLSKPSSSAVGGEEIILLCEKVK